tara:strand:- start:1333 stop:2385 length:1053 start_codon:yes stop_codon:yes gene_type:complete
MIQEFDVDRGGEYLLLPFTLNGKTYQFVLDTGTEITVLDVALRDELGKQIGQVKLKAPNGHSTANIYQAPLAFVGKLKFGETGYVICSDLIDMRRTSGKNVYGILGMDFLQNYVVQIDFDRGKVRIMDDVEHSTESLGKPVRIGFIRKSPPFVIAGPTSDHVSPFLIDTGSNATGTLASNIFDDLKKKNELEVLTSTKLQTITGISSVESGRLPVLVVKGSVLRNLIVKKSDSNSLGLGFWSRHFVTFDFPDKVIYLHEGKRFNEPDHSDLSGLHLLRIDGRTVVAIIDETSPAEKAGIQQADEIVRIDKEDVTNQSLFSIRQQFRSATTSINLTVNRKGHRIKLVVVLQ